MSYKGHLIFNLRPHHAHILTGELILIHNANDPFEKGCPAATMICYNCKEMGHFARCCTKAYMEDDGYLSPTTAHEQDPAEETG